MADPRQGVGRNTVLRRAQELKRELKRPTIKLPDSRASSYEQNMYLGRTSYGAATPRRRSLFLPLCIALFLGALSMTLPVSGTFTLQGTLLENAPVAAVPAATTPGAPVLPEGTAGRAVVFAESAECAWAQLDEPLIVTVDRPAQSDLVMSASVLSIQAFPQAADAVEKHPPCRVELALLPEGEEAVVLRSLPLGAAARADFPTTRNWIGAIVAQLPTDSRQALDKASAGAHAASGFVRQLYRTYVAPRLHQAQAK